MNVYCAVQVKTGKELIVKQVLSRVLCSKLKDQPVEVLVPVQITWRKTRTGYKKHNTPVLTGYVLIKCRRLTDNLYHIIKNTPGVSRVLRGYISLAEFQVMTERVCSTVSVCMRVRERVQILRGRLLSYLNNLKDLKKVVKANLKGKRNPGYKLTFRPLII